jgi:hypothetical protein
MSFAKSIPVVVVGLVPPADAFWPEYALDPLRQTNLLMGMMSPLGLLPSSSAWRQSQLAEASSDH